MCRMQLPYLGEVGFWGGFGIFLIIYGVVGIALQFPSRLIAFLNLLTGLVILWWTSE